MSKLLIAEDEEDLAIEIKEYLEDENFVVEIALDGIEAEDLLRVYKYDLIILDWMMPGKEGVTVCKEFRQRGGVTPVIMLTAKSTPDDTEYGLSVGADYYLKKPFVFKELLANIRAALRRSSGTPSTPTADFMDLKIDPASRKLLQNGIEIHLEPREFNLLEFLIRHPNEVFSADALIDRVWPSDSLISNQAIRTYIKSLRRKLGSEGQTSIVNVRGIGYKLESKK